MSNSLLRTLISEMVETYLEESYEDDLVESIFEEVSNETWEAIEEAILNELSPKTLASYTKKATKSLDKAKSTIKKDNDEMERHNTDLRNAYIRNDERGADAPSKAGWKLNKKMWKTHPALQNTVRKRTKGLDQVKNK
jgi:hypothetical protein